MHREEGEKSFEGKIILKTGNAFEFLNRAGLVYKIDKQGRGGGGGGNHLRKT
jgi:hypothetical protein